MRGPCNAPEPPGPEGVGQTDRTARRLFHAAVALSVLPALAAIGAMLGGTAFFAWGVVNAVRYHEAWHLGVTQAAAGLGSIAIGVLLAAACAYFLCLTRLLCRTMLAVERIERLLPDGGGERR